MSSASNRVTRALVAITMLLGLVASVGPPAKAIGTGAFVAHPATPSFGTGNSRAAALGDLDGDGDLDAVVANNSGQAETVWVNNGSGSFTAHPATPSFGSGNSWVVALGDLDRDGDLDAVVANDGIEAETVWRNDGLGSFAAHPVTASFGTGNSTAVALGDLDGDGDLDAVVANGTNEPETVWRNDGLGSFAAHPVTPSFGAGTSTGVALGDLDADGDLDAVVANASNQAETVWSNDGTGSFTAHPTTPSFGTGNSAEVTLGDLDGDGDLDAVVANAGTQAETVWLNNGAGVFAAHLTTPSFGTGDSFGVALGDLDRDGDLDAVVANASAQAETVWSNNGAGSFSAHSVPSFGAGDSFGVALGDLDRDGDPDAVVANNSGQAETVWLNANAARSTTGQMRAHPTPSFGTGADLGVALGDLDGDGDLDAVGSTTGRETVWMNNGAGSFTAHLVTPTFGSGVSIDIALGDLDGDGDLDALVANTTNQPETVWLNDGSGSFTAHLTTPSFGAGDSWDVDLGDLDGDGDLDAVVANVGTQGETVWLNDGSGSFTAQPTTPSFGVGNSEDVALGDLDGDGDLDAVVANHGGGEAETVWLNDGSGSFTAHLTTPSFGAQESRAMALGDLDGDGDLDAVVANSLSQPETVWLNNGSGSFTAHPATPSFGSGVSFDIALGDLDGDGDLDAVVANTTSGPETVWLNNGSGSFTAHPATPSFGAGNSRAMALGDLDRDGDLDAVIADQGEAVMVWLQVNAESAGPSCSYTIVNANPKRVDFTVSDAGTGLWTIQVTTAVNILPVSIPSFTAGTTSSVAFSAVKDNQSLGSKVAVVITDVQGNQASCI